MSTSDVVVLVVRRGTASWLVDVLRDFSALGLVGTACVVDVDAIRPGEIRIPARVLAGGRARATFLQDELSSLHRVTRVRVVALSEVDRAVHSPTIDDAATVAEAVTGALPSADLGRLHLISVALQGASLTDDLAWLGWHNVLLAPENAQTPDSGISPVVVDDTPALRRTHVASAVCSLAGLWTTAASSPLDDRPIPPGAVMVAARTYTRHLGADTVQSQLLTRLADMSSGYPTPQVEGAAALVVEDQVGASTEMAERLLRKHAHVLPRLRERPRASAPEKIGLLKAIRWFLQFLLSALRNAPRAFVDRVVREVSASVAGAAQSIIFGSRDSEYAIVVNGVTADGTPADWAEVDETVDRLHARLSGRSDVAGPVSTDLTAFWKDYVAAGLTLLDAERRSSELEPIRVGSQRGIVTVGRRVAPDPADLHAPSENVAAYLGGSVEVAPHDVIGARALNHRLEALGQAEPHAVGQVKTAQASLREWYADKEQSYSGRVGLTLARAISDVRREIGELAEALRSAETAAEVPDGIAEQQKKLQKKLRLFLLVAGVVSGGAALLGFLDVLAWPFVGAVIVVSLITWFVTSLAAFMRGQSELFALLHRRRELASQIETLRRHLLEALEDLRRVSRAYRQYGDWTAALGRFVRSPLGRPVDRLDSDLLLGSGFPRNHRFGAARPDDVVLDESAARMRRDLFGVGWLSDAWALFLADVPRSMGADKFRVEDEPDVLFADPGITRQSLLRSWSRAVSVRAEWEGTAESLVERVGELLGGSDLAPRLLAQVQTRDAAGVVSQVSYAEFVNGLDALEDQGGRHAFARTVFGAAAADHLTRVADTSFERTSSGLGLTLVVTQLSQGFALQDILVSPLAQGAGTVRDQLDDVQLF